MTDALDRFEYAAMAYGRLNKLTKDDEKTREMRKSVIAELAASRSAIMAHTASLEERIRGLEGAVSMDCLAASAVKAGRSRSSFAQEAEAAFDEAEDEARALLEQK